MKKYIYLAVIFIAIPFFASAQSFDKDLYYGLRNDSSVTELQEFLTDQGFYSGPITSNFFSLTLSAVKKFQITYSIIPAYGYFGPKSRTRANELLAASGVSQTEVVNETGAAVPVTTITPKNTTDVVNSLNEQIKILQQQLVVLQQQQTSLQQQNQQSTQQTQALQQIQQQTTQSTQSATPTPVPAATITYMLEFTHIGGGYYIDYGGFKPTDPASLKPYEGYPDYSELAFGLIIFKYDSSNPGRETVKDATVVIETTDPSQNKTLNSTGNLVTTYNNGQKEKSWAYPFTYHFKTAGDHTITFKTPYGDKSVTVKAN